MTKEQARDAVARAIGFVRLHARRDPRFAKGPDKARIIEARDIVAALDSRTGDEADYVLVPTVATRSMVDAADACPDAYSAYAAMVEVARVR